MEYDDVEFRDIAGAAGYRIGSDGSLWSCRSFGKSRKLVATWRRLAIHRRNYGSRYCVVCIRLSPGKSPVSCHYVHRLVLEAFVGPCPEGMECRHLDGDTANNALSNLAWGTPQENAADKSAHGMVLRGEQNCNAKLRERHIPIIHALAREGFPYDRIAGLFGVAPSIIRRVVNGTAWRHVMAEWRASGDDYVI